MVRGSSKNTHSSPTKYLSLSLTFRCMCWPVEPMNTCSITSGLPQSRLHQSWLPSVPFAASSEKWAWLECDFLNWFKFSLKWDEGPPRSACCFLTRIGEQRWPGSGGIIHGRHLSLGKMNSSLAVWGQEVICRWADQTVNALNRFLHPVAAPY